MKGEHNANNTMMLKKQELYYSIIKNRIFTNKLDVFANILFGFIFKNYDLTDQEKGKIIEQLELNEELMYKYTRWPFDSQEVYDIKKADFEARLKCRKDNKRVYLQPLYVFREDEGTYSKVLAAINSVWDNVKSSNDAIASVELGDFSLYACEVGIFIDVYSGKGVINRKLVKRMILDVLEKMNITTYNAVPYSMEYLANWYF